jgi:hypothetical protein
MATRFRIGEVITAGLRVWIRHLGSFVAITVLIYAPMVFWGGRIAGSELDFKPFYAMLERFAFASLLAVPLRDMLVSALITYGIVMQLHGRSASFDVCIARGFRRFFPAFGTLVVVALCAAGPIAALTASLSTDDQRGLGAIAVVLCVSTVFYVALPASIVERPLLSALRRSWALTRGHWIAIGFLQLALQALGFVFAIAVQRLLWNRMSMVYLELARSVAFGSLVAAISAVAYCYLRAEKDGTSVAELAAILDRPASSPSPRRSPAGQ